MKEVQTQLKCLCVHSQIAIQNTRSPDFFQMESCSPQVWAAAQGNAICQGQKSWAPGEGKGNCATAQVLGAGTGSSDWGLQGESLTSQS